MIRKWVKLLIIIAVPILLIVGWWLLSPLLIDNKVDETFPVPSSSETSSHESNSLTNVDASDNQTEDTTAKQDPEESTDTNTEAESTPEKYKGVFVDGERSYKSKGNAFTVTADLQHFIRFEDFDVTNGPDLFVYLVQPGMKTSDGINLGKLKGNIGNQNYELPGDVDLSIYNRIVIYCKAFSRNFGYAELTSYQ